MTDFDRWLIHRRGHQTGCGGRRSDRHVAVDVSPPLPGRWSMPTGFLAILTAAKLADYRWIARHCCCCTKKAQPLDVDETRCGWLLMIRCVGVEIASGGAGAVGGQRRDAALRLRPAPALRRTPWTEWRTENLRSAAAGLSLTSANP